MWMLLIAAYAAGGFGTGAKVAHRFGQDNPTMDLAAHSNAIPAALLAFLFWPFMWMVFFPYLAGQAARERRRERELVESHERVKRRELMEALEREGREEAEACLRLVEKGGAK